MISVLFSGSPRTGLLALLAAFVASPAAAAIVEEVFEVPVSVRSLFGQEVHQPIKLTLFRDDTRDKAPYLVINHGRPASEADFAKMKRVRYSAVARWFVEQGFAVLVPTRVGYGESGGPDVEYSGKCEFRDFPTVYATAAEETRAVLDYAARHLPVVDLHRGVVVGQSFGGATAITLSTMALPGLKAAINFAGGGGGNPVTRPGNPCSAQRMATMLAGYGKLAHVPTLWLYSENDQFFGLEWPRTWFDGFVAAGGDGRFIRLPAYGQDGHGIFSGQPAAWQPEVGAFLRQLGF